MNGDDVMMPLTSSEIEHIASEAAKKAVRELLLAMGADVSDPKEIRELQKDFAHTRESRLAIAAVKIKVVLVATGTVVTGIIAACWIALRGGSH